MAFRALSGLVPQWIEPERFDLSENGKLKDVDPETDDLVRVEIKPLNGREYYAVLQNPADASRLACATAVTNWENFKDEEGKPVEFSKSKVLEFIPAKYIAIIGAKVLEVSTLDGKQVKNS